MPISSKTPKISAILENAKKSNIKFNNDSNKTFLELFFSSEFVNQHSFLESIFSKKFKNILTNKSIILLNSLKYSETENLVSNTSLKHLTSLSSDKSNNLVFVSSQISEFNSYINYILKENEKNSIHFKTSYKRIKDEINKQLPLIILNLQDLSLINSEELTIKKLEKEDYSYSEYQYRISLILYVLNFMLKILLINFSKLSSNLKIVPNIIKAPITFKKSTSLINRENETNRIIQILARKTKSNPILIGETGVGKSSILERLAIKLLRSVELNPLSKNRILSIDLELLIANDLFKQQFEKRLKNIIFTIKQTSQTVLILKNINILLGLDAKESSLEIKNLLKLALSSNKIQCVGSTTVEEYKQLINKDNSLEVYFQPVTIKEPDIILTLQILQAIKKNYEDYHWVTYNTNSIKAAVNLSSQYITDRFLPEKAIDLIDEAGAYAKLKNFNIPNSGKFFYYQLLKIREQKTKAVSLENYEAAKNYLKKEFEFQSLVSGHMKLSCVTSLKKPFLVSEIEIATIVASWTGIPVSKVSKAESENLLQMEDILHQRIIGQHQAIVAVSKAIRRARVGLKNPNRPIASFIFAGPTGVGKTELTKALAFYFFGSESNMVRLDMSEYMEKHTVAKLIGSPPGYIGYNEGGQLTEAVRQKPYTVVLFDEMEKAHPDIFNLLLQILEDGHLTDSKGRKVDFKNTLIILTSNVGARVIENSQKNNSIFNNSFNDKTKSVYKKIWHLVNQELKNQFKPEFLNRLDEIIVFSQLTLDDITQIAEIMIKQLIKRIQKQNGIHLIITDRVKYKVIKEGFNPIYGARPLRRAVMNLLEDNLATKFLTNELSSETKLIVDLDNNDKISLVIDKNIE
jgi:ATP-dependent Clp protease ATP-binding subunit ClpC